MNFGFSEKQKSFHEAAVQSGRKLRTPQPGDADAFRACWASCATAGIPALTLPAAPGGPGMNALETAITLSGFAEGCADNGFSFSVAAHLLAGLAPLAGHADHALQERIFPLVQKGDFILANAMTEAHSGSDAFSLRTVAERSGDTYLLSGTKIFCTNAPVADGILVYALTDAAKGFFGGITCFLLEKGKHTYTVDAPLKKSGLHTSPLASVFLDRVEVKKDAIVGKEGGGGMIFIDSMNRERACIAAMHAGTMKRLSKQTADYVRNRHTAKSSLDQLQGVQFRIAEMFLLTETSLLSALKAAAAIDEKKDAITAAAQAKIMASESLHKVAREAVMLHGGNGFTEAYGITGALADAQAAAIYSGPDDVLRELIAGRL